MAALGTAVTAASVASWLKAGQNEVIGLDLLKADAFAAQRRGDSALTRELHA